jgi:hypothetical protein
MLQGLGYASIDPTIIQLASYIGNNPIALSAAYFDYYLSNDDASATYQLKGNYASLVDVTALQTELHENYLASSIITRDYLSLAVASDIYQSKIEDIKVGNIGSFYSCSDIVDNSQVLIAQGSTSIEGRLLAQQNCNNWARKIDAFYKIEQLQSVVNNSFNLHDIYVGTGDGECLKIEDSVFKTAPVKLTDTGGNIFYVPALTVLVDQISPASVSAVVSSIDPSIYVSIDSRDVTYYGPGNVYLVSDGSYTTSASTTLNVPFQEVIAISTDFQGLYSLCNYMLDHAAII